VLPPGGRLGTVDHVLQVSRKRRRLERFKAWRRRIAARPRLNAAYRVGVAIVGTLVLVVGFALAMMPTPGPGWVMVAGGLGLLSSEFVWARKVVDFFRGRLRAIQLWFLRRSMATRVALLGSALVIVAFSLWSMGAVAMIGGWFGIDHAWMALSNLI